MSLDNRMSRFAPCSTGPKCRYLHPILGTSSTALCRKEAALTHQRSPSHPHRDPHLLLPVVGVPV